MSLDRRTAARIAAPVAFLVAVTIAVLVVRSGLQEDAPAARPSQTQPRPQAVTVVVRAGDTLDGIAPAGDWQDWWQRAVDARRAAAPWQATGQVKA